MRSEHRLPLAAFVVLALASAVFLSYSLLAHSPTSEVAGDDPRNARPLNQATSPSRTLLEPPNLSKQDTHPVPGTSPEAREVTDDSPATAPAPSGDGGGDSFPGGSRVPGDSPRADDGSQASLAPVSPQASTAGVAVGEDSSSAGSDEPRPPGQTGKSTNDTGGPPGQLTGGGLSLGDLGNPLVTLPTLGPVKWPVRWPVKPSGSTDEGNEVDPTPQSPDECEAEATQTPSNHVDDEPNAGKSCPSESGGSSSTETPTGSPKTSASPAPSAPDKTSGASAGAEPTGR